MAEPDVEIAAEPPARTAVAEALGRTRGILGGARRRRAHRLARVSVHAGGWNERARPPPPARTDVRIAVLPFQFFSTDPAIAMLAARLTDGVTTELARLGTLSVVSRTSAAQFMSEQRPVSEVASILGADLIMEGSAIVEEGRLKVVARLVDGVLDRKVWVGEYQGSPDEVSALESRIAAEAGPAAIKVKETQKN